MAHSYVLYPFLLKLLPSRNLLPRQHAWQPDVHILMAVRNGEKIIANKIASVFTSNYPLPRIHLWIGSDASGDGTDSIIQHFQQQYPNIHFTRFEERHGKIQIINALFDQATSHTGFENSLIISTDVTAIFDTQCIASLVSVFVNEKVGVVGSNILKHSDNGRGIALQEQAYYARELQMKHKEGLLWGATMGVFGACFAIRPNVFEKVPAHFVADDFFITLSAFAKGYNVLLDNEAKVFMNLPTDPKVEYNRKVRISTGNFQNLFHFFPLLFKPDAVAFAYWSHKVIRWLGPLFIIGCLLSAIVLKSHHVIYELALYTQLFVISLIPLGWMLSRVGIQNKLLRFVMHFYHMNLGILVGLFKYIKGVRSSVWEPTQR